MNTDTVVLVITQDDVAGAAQRLIFAGYNDTPPAVLTAAVQAWLEIIIERILLDPSKFTDGHTSPFASGWAIAIERAARQAPAEQP